MQELTMQVTGDTSVGELLAMHPAARTVFEIFGIDACCGQPRSLRDACASAALDTDEAIDLLEGRAITTALPLFPQADAPLSELTKAIVKHHHRRARKRLIALIQSARSLCGAHASRFPELWRVRDQIEKLARSLIPHMINEERFLFPYINTFETGSSNAAIVPLFGSVEFPLQSLRHDHSDDLQSIATLRETTRNFKVPEGACQLFGSLYAELSDFSREIQQHVHIENDTLFPRAVEMEKRMARGSAP
ncbi:MAG: DUF542 domain-containing protein [Thermoanaerobaculia bacterium]